MSTVHIEKVWSLTVFALLACHASGPRRDTLGPVVASGAKADTAQQAGRWPLLVDRLPELDTSRVVTDPRDSIRIFRTDISLTFKPYLTDSAKATFLERHSMRVIGVTPVGRFFVRIPDPGPTLQSLLQLIDALRAEPEVARAGWIQRDPPPGH